MTIAEKLSLEELETKVLESLGLPDCIQAGLFHNGKQLHSAFPILKPNSTLTLHTQKLAGGSNSNRVEAELADLNVTERIELLGEPTIRDTTD